MPAEGGGARRAITVLLVGPKDSGINALSSSEDRRVCAYAYAQTRLSLSCSQSQRTAVDEISDQNLDLCQAG